MKELGEGYSLSGKSIYYHDSETFTSLRKIIDHNTFELIGSFEDKTFYFKDKKNVYVSSYMCRPSVIEGADQETFKIFDASEGIGYDRNGYYWYDKKLPYDYSQAEPYNGYYLRSGENVFFITEKAEGADADSFSIIWQNIGRDKHSLYFRGKKDTNVAVDTFKMVPGCFEEFHLDQSHTYYAFDQNHVYFVNTLSQELKKLSRIKPSGFSVKVIDERLYGFYADAIYFFGRKRKNLNLKF